MRPDQDRLLAGSHKERPMSADEPKNSEYRMDDFEKPFGLKGTIPGITCPSPGDEMHVISPIRSRALELGATSVDAPADKPYQERNAGVRDSFGNIWWISTYTG